jgi:hypothetical protein
MQGYGKRLASRLGTGIVQGSVQVPVQTDPTFQPGRTGTLFRGTYVTFLWAADIHPWDISPDGKRFPMMKEAGSTAPTAGGPRKINIALNRLEELKQRVPVK